MRCCGSGYAGSPTQVRRLVRLLRPQIAAPVYRRLTVLAGEEAQVDWGSFGTVRIGRGTRPLSGFVMVLSYSRAIFALFTLDQTLESFLRGHVEAFGALGGSARTLVYDNLKSAVLERQGAAIRFHPRLLDLAGHYHFAPRPCTPGRGNEKGKVERQIRYLRDAFFAARTFRDVDDLNAQFRRWRDELAHQRPHPDHRDRTVGAVFAEEQARLLPLPAHPFETDALRAVTARKQPYVAQGLGKTMLAKNLVHQAVLAGHAGLFVTASELLLDLNGQETSRALERRLRHYARPTLLAIDEIGYLSYDARAADLLYQVVSRRYEQKSVVLTTNLAFKHWDSVFPNAGCAVALVDRLTHHAEIIAIEGESYRRREADSLQKHRRSAK
jgi:transposase